MNITKYTEFKAYLSCRNNCGYTEKIFKYKDTYYKQINKKTSHDKDCKISTCVGLTKAQREFINELAKNNSGETRNVATPMETLKMLKKDENMKKFNELGGTKENLSLYKKISNILQYERKLYLDSFPNEISFIQQTLKDDLISINISANNSSFIIAAKRDSLKRLFLTENVCFDKTHSKTSEGVYVLSEKVTYDFHRNNKQMRKRGQKCIAWVYIFTKGQNCYLLRNILSVIKLEVERMAGCEWIPKYFTVDFDQDK